MGPNGGRRLSFAPGTSLTAARRLAIVEFRDAPDSSLAEHRSQL
jgi:hypothetical protein